MTTHSMKRSGTKNIVTYRNELVGNTAYSPTSTIVTGGTLFSDATYYYQAFTNSAILNVTNGSLTADILVVAGGGGGGSRTNRGGGGGGAGGLQGFTSQTLTAGSYLITVGAGGAGSLTGGDGTAGGNSKFGSLTASVGGGGGGSYAVVNAGGSGGGASGDGTATSGGAGTTGQGFAGGTTGALNNSSGYIFSAGGGGGATAVGAAGIGAFTTGAGGAGGAGSSAYSSWGLATTTGQNVSGTYYYAGGGGGGVGAYNGGDSLAPGIGGLGGGAAGLGSVTLTAPAGTSNTGGGGGGGNAYAGNGGSGIVIVRYLKSAVVSVQADFELIGTVLVNATTSSVTFTGIPAGYKHLQLRTVTQHVSIDQDFKLTFNGDTGANYSLHYLQGQQSATASGSGISQSGIELAYNYQPSGYATTSFVGHICDILDAFSTTKNKTIRSFSGVSYGSTGRVDFRSGLWMSTATITSLTCTSFNGSTFIAGSRFSLYGVRG